MFPDKENKQEKKDMKTLVSCLHSLIKQGFTTDFKVVQKGLKALNTEKVYDPASIKILNFYRFEGETDPGDNSILYAIEAADATRGTLVDAYGPYADSRVTNFIKQVEDIFKKTNKGSMI